ncbi:hypothetical protein [Ectopseudomonas alcaliphila]|uniref:Uncharacterized protein n=1 Tax=Ectopseudomonas alcaliphila TaxID=101564 RepID=A0A1G7IRU9_9GAMM|nr:hypothetical protein [Pseudomonas alcaliphila]MDX5995237.1 hypothetical protein [Pseudomonas alcaliphila]SDF15318.1 hypothetical protein SAMN05216575_10614 [Pseudomonas alcaliphila]
MDRRILGLSLLLLATATASAETIPSLIGPVSHIVVIEDGLGPEQENCQNFKVSEAMVADFLRHAILITHRQEHDWYLYGPCQAHGTLSTRYGEWQWQLLNLGTARITAVTGESFMLADPREESSLEDE